MKMAAVLKSRRICYVAPTYQQARDIAWEMLKKELGPLAIQTNESRLEIRVAVQGGGESLILLRGWESVENLRGQAFDLVVIDEVAMMRNFWTNWQEVIRPTLTDRKGQVLFCSTPKGFNHFFDLCNLELKDKDFKSFHFTSYDNPYLPREELDTAKTQLTPDRFAQEYLADFKKTEGLVYKEFSRDKHLYVNLPDKPLERVAGVDFGYVNPAAVLEIRTNGEEFYIEDEWYKRGRTEAQIAEYVAQQTYSAVYPDPESPSAIEELRNRMVNTREVVKGRDSVQSGVQKVRELLVRGKLKVNQRCINTIAEFETYSYDDEKDDRDAKEKPVKANDHALDALRYVVMMTLPPDKRDDQKLYETRRELDEAFADHGLT